MRRLLAILALLLASAPRPAPALEEEPFLQPAFGPALPGLAMRPIAAFADLQITGVAAAGLRVFVCSPDWGDPHLFSVLAIGPERSRPYPDDGWNRWHPLADPRRHFVCVQSVHVDPRRPETLWILDAGSPDMAGVLPGAAKLVAVDLRRDEVDRVILFPPDVAPVDAYLNDVRVDADGRWAYVSDSGSGAIVVVDLVSGASRRLLHGHPAVMADPGVVIAIDGRPLVDAEGEVPMIHVDGIALGDDDRWLYFQPLRGRTLYRVATEALQEGFADGDVPPGAVERVGDSVMADGIATDAAGLLHFAAIEWDAVVRRDPGGVHRMVMASERLLWPDSLAFDGAGRLLVTTSQVHLMPRFNGGERVPVAPYAVWAIAPE